MNVEMYEYINIYTIETCFYSLYWYNNIWMVRSFIDLDNRDLDTWDTPDHFTLRFVD